MSQPSRNHRPQREKNGGHYSERRDREPRSLRDNPSERSGSERSSGQPPYYPRGSQRHVRSAPREHRESKCSYICSRRGTGL